MQNNHSGFPIQDDEMEMQLWAYIDGILPAPEQSAIEKLIAQNNAWKARYS